MKVLTCWCNAEALVWVITLALDFGGMDAIKEVREGGSIADYRLELQFPTSENLDEFFHLSHKMKKLV